MSYFVLKCGLHWTSIDPTGLHATSCDADRATRFTTRSEAEAAKQRLERRPYAGPHEIVEVSHG